MATTTNGQQFATNPYGGTRTRWCVVSSSQLRRQRPRRESVCVCPWNVLSIVHDFSDIAVAWIRPPPLALVLFSGPSGEVDGLVVLHGHAYAGLLQR